MHSRLKQSLRCCALLLLLCCGSSAQASFQEPDSVYTAPDSASVSYHSEYTESEAMAPEPPRVVIYNRQAPSEARWLEATSDDAYTYRTKQEYVKRDAPPPQEPPGWLTWLGYFFAFLSTTAGKVILFSLLALLIAFIVYRIIASERGLFAGRDLKPATAAADALSEEGLMELNWEARMREALAAGDQRQAIRFGYLHLLQQLQLRRLISFRPDKTNIAYYRELGEEFRPGFRNLTRIYEFAWYGAFLPDAAGLAAYVNNIDQYLQHAPKA